MIKDITKHLAFNHSNKVIKETDIGLKLERYRGDQHNLTSELLENISNTDKKHLKKLFNY